MTIRTIALITTASLLAACSGAADTAEKVAAKTENTVKETVTKVAGPADAAVKTKGASLAELPAGTYKSEQGHAYIAFQYDHQGFSTFQNRLFAGARRMRL